MPARWSGLIAAMGVTFSASGQVPVVTNTLSVEHHVDNRNGRADDDHYAVGIDRLNVAASSEELTAAARADGWLFSRYPSPAYRSVAVLERMFVRYQLGPLDLTAGDFQIQLGRGISLAIRKGDELGVDRALRGGKLEYASETQEAEVFAGLANTANLDSISQRHVEDRADLLAGAAWALRAPGPKVGVFALYASPEERLLEERDWAVTAGGFVELAQWREMLSLYLEVDGQLGRLAGSERKGGAAYAVADLQLPNGTLLAEGLFLSGIEQKGSRSTATGARFEYNRPPTLERLEEEVLNNRDVLGGRLRFDHNFREELSAFGSIMLRFTDAGTPAQVRQLHGIAGVEWHFDDGASHLAFNAGARRESTVDGAALKTAAHASIEVVKSLSAEVSVHFSSTNEWRTLEERASGRGTTLLGLEKGRLGSISAELGWDTFDPSVDRDKVFLAGIVTFQPRSAVSSRLLIGTQRGGLKCIAGVCREFPAFAGVRGELTLKY